MDNERLRYLTLTKIQHTGKSKAIQIIMKETKFQGTVEDMAQIVFTPTKEEQILHILKHRLTCDRCKTNDHIVADPIVFNFKGDLTDNVEYYCANRKAQSSLFSKCWNHVQAYENRKGENKLTLVQDTA